jgi:hypothetical protein
MLHNEIEKRQGSTYYLARTANEACFNKGKNSPSSPSILFDNLLDNYRLLCALPIQINGLVES